LSSVKFSRLALTKVQAIVIIVVVIAAAVGTAGLFYSNRPPLTSLTSVTSLSTSVQYFSALRAAAEKEGQVTIYVTWPVTVSQKLTLAWQTRFPNVKINFVQLSASILAARLITEFQSGKVQADVVAGPSVSFFNVWRSQNLLGQYHPVNITGIPAKFVPDNSFYIEPAIRLLPLTVIYNTNLVKSSDLPSDMMGILNNTQAISQWKGKFVMDDPSRDATMTEWLVGWRQYFNSNQSYNSFLSNLKEAQPTFVSSLIPAAQAISSGQNAIGITSISYIASLAPAPLGYVPSKPLLALLQVSGVANNAPHPNAAKLFIEFLYSPAGVSAVAAAGEITTGGIQPPISGIQNLEIVPAKPLTADEALVWQSYFKEFFGIT
jgi:iron(III) transport system substrate-binding protein